MAAPSATTHARQLHSRGEARGAPWVEAKNRANRHFETTV